jgi:arylsulfatase A-like enzyme
MTRRKSGPTPDGPPNCHSSEIDTAPKRAGSSASVFPEPPTMRTPLLALAALASLGAPALAQTPADRAVPHYAHIFVIVEENKDYGQIIDPKTAPNIASLAAEYGNATRFYGEAHPSEENYVALVGGDTFGIHDDDAYYCKAGSTDKMCPGALVPGYADHTVHAPHLGMQLEHKGLSWKGYYEDLPAPGSLAVRADHGKLNGSGNTAFYAAKHSGFLNFASVQNDPHRAEHLVDFKQLDADLASGHLPAFALIVPNQCNEMHGLHGDAIPADCQNYDGLVRRGDQYTADLVKKIQATPAWRSPENVAIVVTFDEGFGSTRSGCCGVTPDAPSNFGGGHIPTVVLTNHGPRGVKDDTPYNHYSLLRTIEDAFGINEHLAHAAETDKGVVPMVPLFATSQR